ncbi:hypothetical protein KUTeg_021836 [Tegillarca granosa]|uniref:Uncharacterized protein n=1 Tax=Tegillarca granosa TaxID=220873 RepID=A0ABQ9E8W5_TEGGR|nr:hypothetical protein KUTeg_021836 [Tegillarca granosa]
MSKANKLPAESNEIFNKSFQYKFQKCKRSILYIYHWRWGSWLRPFNTTAKFMGSDPVKVCAPTGTAAKNIRGKTIHSTLFFCLFNMGNNQNFSSFLRRRLKNCDTISQMFIQ